MPEELFVYADRMEYFPGDAVQLHVSATRSQEVTITLVKPSASGDTDTLDHACSEVDAVPAMTAVAEFQRTHNGSFGIVEDVAMPQDAPALTMLAYVWPTRPGEAVQPILSWRAGSSGLELGLDAAGHLTGTLTDDDRSSVVTGDQALAERQWYLVGASVEHGRLRVLQVPIGSSDPGDRAGDAAAVIEGPDVRFAERGTLLIAARELVAAGDGQRRTTDAFDGKIDAPALLAEGVTLERLQAAELDAPEWQERAFAAWDFANGFDTDVFVSRSEHQPAGVLVNAPARGMTGRNWTGDSLDFRSTPEQYGAIHFHSDDLEDAAWRRTAVLQLPEDLPSGIYAARVVGEGVEDHTPLFVSRSPAKERGGDVLFLAPTFSYIAYANSRLAEELDYTGGVLTDLDIQKQFRDSQVYERREFGMSLYDHHVDGSGSCYSTHLRPIPNMRWDFRSGLQSAPRHFAADITWPAWFDAEQIGYDVLSDHGLHRRGADALQGYRLLITASHPEYWSGRMLDAVEEYLDGGGSLAYVGGNGFYWVTSASADRPHLVEVRRGQQGIRTWEGQPGEGVSTQSGEPGGLWRLRGRAPNRLVGVGMAAQGWDTSTPGFERTEASRDPRAADLFDGIDEDVIGDFGLVLGGAAGDEIDRADFGLGTPRHALVLARSQPHSKYYLAASEELQTPTPHINGTNNANVHADVTFFEHKGGGFVVSTSAITWTGSLAYRRFDNNVSRFMRNVVRKALSD